MNIDRTTDGLDRLSQSVPVDSLITDLETRAAYSADLYSRGTNCEAIFRPRDKEVLAAGVAAAAAAGMTIIPRGAGLTYTGGYVSESRNVLLVDLSAMNRVVAFSAEDLYVTAQAGCTWKQLYETLSPHGLRLPFFGTFSGAVSTVGGGLSSGAMFFGSARYGSAADNVLSLEIVLADGKLMRAGQAAVRNSAIPAYRTYGPDFVGLFTHDSGALGIKAEATFRLIRTPSHTGFASFAFNSPFAAAAALSEIARSGAAEEAYVLDADSTRASIDSVTLSRAVETALKVVKQSGGLLRGASAAARMALGMKDLRADVCSLHVVCAARSEAALRADIDACRAAAASHGGTSLPDTVPRAARAALFPPLNSVLGEQGQRWAAVNCKTPHSEAKALLTEVESILSAHQQGLSESGIRVAHLMSALGSHSFSYEAVFHWSDAWLPLHERAPEPSRLRALPRPEENLSARALVHEVREQLIALFARNGAASNQIGRAYPYLDLLHDESRELLVDVKRLLDPEGRMNPGVMGLG